MEKPLHSATPSLAPPGAGLPKAEEFILRHLAMPIMGALIPWRYAADTFQTEGRRILSLVDGLDATILTTRSLVPRLMAMEDNSRHWSVAMTMRHLVIVGEVIEDIIITLTQSRPCTISVDIAAVKPEPETPASVVEEFQNFLTRFDAHLRDNIGDRHSMGTHSHPWLGPLKAQQWLCLAGVHQRLHRRQIQLILAQLQRTQP